MLKRKNDPWPNLPKGYDDANSPWHIPEDARPHYDVNSHHTRQQVSDELDRLAVDEARDRQRAWFAEGEQLKDRDERREFMKLWASRNRVTDELEWRYDLRPLAHRAADPDAHKRRMPEQLYVQPMDNPTAEQLALADHRLRLAPALAAAARVRRQAEAQARHDRRHTCAACGEVAASVKLREARSIWPDAAAWITKPQLCDPCADDVPLIAPVTRLIGGPVDDPAERDRLAGLIVTASADIPQLGPIGRLLTDADRRQRLRDWAASWLAERHQARAELIRREAAERAKRRPRPDGMELALTDTIRPLIETSDQPPTLRQVKFA